MTCSPLDKPTNGHISYSSVDSLGAVATYNCAHGRGFVLSGVRQRVCDTNGDWSGEETTCARGTKLC